MSNLWRRLTYAMTAVSSMYVIHLYNKTSSNQLKYKCTNNPKCMNDFNTRII